MAKLLSREELFALAKAQGKAYVSPQKCFSYANEKLSAEALQTKFMEQLCELGKTPHDFDENKNLIFRLIEESYNEVLPPMILDKYGDYAEVKTIGLGDRPVFKVRISEASRRRAKQFITKVGAAGRYETFKLDGYEFTLNTDIHGGAARVEWEEVLRNRFTMADYYNLTLEGLQEDIYREIAKSLETTVKSVKTVNKTSQNTFDEQEMDRLLATADTYGQSTIYCTFEFATTMLPADGRWSDEMKNQIWQNGAFTNYKKHNVVILPQSFTDETNETKVMEPSLAYIIPTGAEKPIKVIFEGGAQVKSFENRDWSTEINTYQRVGVGTYLLHPGICVYENTSLTKDNTQAKWSGDTTTSVFAPFPASVTA